MACHELVYNFALLTSQTDYKYKFYRPSFLFTDLKQEPGVKKDFLQEEFFARFFARLNLLSLVLQFTNEFECNGLK